MVTNTILFGEMSMLGWITPLYDIIKGLLKGYDMFMSEKKITKSFKIEKTVLGSGNAIALYICFDNPSWFKQIAIKDVFIEYETYNFETTELNNYKTSAQQVNEVITGQLPEDRLMFNLKTDSDKYIFARKENEIIRKEPFQLKKLVDTFLFQSGWIVFEVEVKGITFFERTRIHALGFTVSGSDKVYYPSFTPIKEKFMSPKNWKKH